VSVNVETFGTGTLEDEAIRQRVLEHFDFRPAAIMQSLDLQRMPATLSDGFYFQLACYGQMGRTDLELPWERTDKAELLK
jgi:S-adenosylmethionine synthetase